MAKQVSSVIKSEVLPLAALAPDVANVRVHPEKNKRAVTASLRQFGPGRSIVVDGKNVIRAGNQTVESAREAGIDEVLVVEPAPNQLVAVRRSDWTPTQATAYGIGDNHLTDLSGFGPDLHEVLRGLEGEGFDLDSIGFDLDELANLDGSPDGTFIDQVEAPEDFSEKDETIETEHRCPKCGYRWSGRANQVKE